MRAGAGPGGDAAQTAAQTAEAWKEFAGPLRRFVLRRVGNGHDADDVLQEVFLKAHAAMGGMRDRRLLKPWLYRIAQNAVADHHRARRAAPSEELLTEPHEPDANGEMGGPDNANGEVLACLGPMVYDLPDGYRRALVLADLEGKTQRQVAGELELSLPGAKSRVQRARRKLKAALLSCCRLELDRVGNVLECERREGTRCHHC